VEVVVIIAVADLIRAGAAGLMILGATFTWLFGTYAGTAAGMLGLIAGPAFCLAWARAKERFHPFVCTGCGSQKHKLGRRKLNTWSISRPVHASDLIQYQASPWRPRIDQITLKRARFEEFRQCRECGRIDPFRTYTLDLDINFSP